MAKSEKGATQLILDDEYEPRLAQQLAAWPETPRDVELPSMAQGMKMAWGFYALLLRR